MQISSSSEIITALVGTVIIVVIIIFLSKALVNWTHEIGYRNRLLEAQIILLAKLLKERGENQNSINQILEEIKNSGNKKGEIVNKYLMDNK